MGAIGKKIGGFLGRTVGRFAGKKLGKYTGVHEDRGGQAGETVGETLGDLVPFKKGGKIRRNGAIYAHKGEFVLPPGVKPTTHQLRIVKKRGGKYR